MAGRQARGHMTLHLDINNAAVGYKLRTMQRQIHQVSRAWKAQSHTLWIAGQHEEALRVKMDGVREQFSLEHEYVDRATKSIEASNRAKEQGNKKYQRLVNNRDAAIQQLQEYSNQVKHAEDLMTLHNDELLRSSRLAQSNTEIGRARVNELKAEGRESEANTQHMRNYRIHLEGLRNEYQAVQHTIQRARDKGLTDPIKFPEFNQERARLHQLQAEIAETTRKQKDFDSNLATGKRYDDLYNQTTNKLIASLKRMKQSAQANRTEYSRLINNQGREAQVLQKEYEKATQVANESGRDSAAYQREESRLASLNGTYAEHISRINVLKNTYGNMSRHVATNIDNQRLKIRRLDLASHRELTTAHSLTNASIALGAGFIYGAHQAMGLENEFNKVRNLLNTSGESYRQSTNDIHKMGKAAEDYSIQYGVSQNDISKGFEALVRRGYTGNQALAAQKSYLQGAIASGDKYSDVMDTAASTLEAFGMRSNNTNKMVGNTKTAVNQLAYAADLTATDFKGISYGMKFTGATAHSANQSLSETSSALGVLSNNGQNATNAGFGLRKVLNSFIAAKDTKAWKKILPQLGLSAKDFQDAQGHFKTLSSMMGMLQSHMRGKTDAEKTDIFHQLFGATGQESALILARNTHQLSSLNGQVAKSQDQDKGRGYAARIARKNMNSTQMQMKRLQMAGEDLAKNYAQGINPAFKRLAGASLKLAEGMSGLPKPFKNAVAIGTTLIPVVAGVNYGLSALNKVHAVSIQASLRMMGIGRSEQEQLKTKVMTTNAATEASKQNNLSITDNIKLLREQQEAEEQKSKSQNASTESDKENTGATVQNTEANSANLTAAERHPKTLGGWDNLTGGTLGTGMTGKAAVRYGGAGLGMGALIGGTEMANGDAKGGGEDALGTAGGTTLGGLVGGPMGAAIGGIAGPMLARSVGHALDHPYNVGKNEKATDSEDRSASRGLDNDLKHINTTTGGFIRREAGLNNQATNQFVVAGGKVTKSLRKTASDMYTTAQRYGNQQLQGEDNALRQAEKAGRITDNQRIQGDNKLKRSEAAVLSNIHSDENKALTNTHLTARQRERLLSSADSYEMRLTSTGGSKQNKLLSDLNRRTSSLNAKSYAAVLSNANSNYKATSKSARTHAKNELTSVSDQYAAMEKAGLINNKSAKASMKSLSGIVGSQRSDTVNKANKTRGSVSVAASNMADDTAKKHSKASASVSAANASMASDDARIASDNAAAWHKFATGFKSFLENAAYDVRHPIHPHENKKVFKKNLGENPLSPKATGTLDTQHVIVDNPVTDSMSSHANGSYDTAALHFAKGVLPGISRNENALINDGGGRELVKLPNGQFVLPSGRNVHTMLPKGTSVFNATQTRRILGMINQPSVHHADGTVGNLGSSKASGSIKVKTPNGSLDKTEKNTRKHMKNIHDALDNGYKKTNKDVQKHLNDLHDNNDDSWSDNYEKTKKHVKKIHDDTSDRYKDLKDDIDSTQKRSNDLTNTHLNTTVSYFRHHFAMIPPISRSSMQGGVANINSGISAIDRVLSQFGGNAHVLNAVHYAAGTSGPSMNKQLAILNDATGGPTQEAVVSDQGRVRMPQGRNVLTALNPGDKVLNGSDTLRAIRSGMIPHYASGKGSHEALMKMIKGYSKQPASFTNGTFNKFAIIMGDILTQGMTAASKTGAQKPANDWSSAMWNYIESLVDGGSSSGLLAEAEKLGNAAKGYSENVSKRMGPSYYDCASLVWQALKHCGVTVGGTTVGPIMSKFAGNRVSREDARPGDLVGSHDHIGLVADKGARHYYSAQDPKDGIGMEPLSESAFPDGWFHIERVPKLANNDESNKHTSPLTPLVKRQLGPSAIKWIKDKLVDSSMGNPSGIGVNRWIPVIKRAAEAMHTDVSGGGLAKVLTTIRHESQGDPTVTQHGYTDQNTGGNEAVGLVQFAKGTFPTYSLPGHFNRRNGYDELLALFNDSSWRSDLMPTGGWIPRGHARYGKVPGYSHGGLTKTDKLAHISEGNKPEMVLPLTDRSRAVQLMLKSLQYMFGNNQSNSQRNNDSQTSASDREFERELIRSNRQKDYQINKLSQTTNNILAKMTILIKTVQNKPVLTETDVFRANRNVTQRKLHLRNLNRGTF